MVRNMGFLLEAANRKRGGCFSKMGRRGHVESLLTAKALVGQNRSPGGLGHEWGLKGGHIQENSQAKGDWPHEAVAGATRGRIARRHPQAAPDEIHFPDLKVGKMGPFSNSSTYLGYNFNNILAKAG